MSFKLLIDECLHPGLVALAKERGIVAEFGPHIGKGGWQDHNLVPFAVENDYIIVTNNRRDFLKLYLQHGLHGGFIILVPRVERRRMDELFALALDALATMNEDLVNKVIEVLADGTAHVRDWSAHSHDVGHIGRPDWS
jgi:predicted nuclease of predicted toxin-antitoxin system